MSTALIAGQGILPVEIARRLRELQPETLILALRDDPEELAPYATRLVKMRSPNLGRGLREIKAFGSDRLIMAGRIPKRIIYCLPLLFDRLTRSVLRKSLRDDHSLLGAIVSVFEAKGITVIPYWQILPEFIASRGKLSSRSPNEQEQQDVAYGREILRVTLPCSFGQAVCVAGGAVVAVEAMEGTDKMIHRAGELAGRGVVVKMMRTDQDMRYDLPTVGTRTIEAMREAGLSCLAVEAGKTLILEPEKFFALADKYKIAVWGIDNEVQSNSK
ncbi:MAG: UDP-2,3-diacylglucosamine diphosphatase LpxI [Synergistaceae bacterium]|nr:UDP-2,3-diacylglucosamine diphosphatase LpxI [Synergistaceae bacterium]